MIKTRFYDSGFLKFDYDFIDCYRSAKRLTTTLSLNFEIFGRWIDIQYDNAVVRSPTLVVRFP